MTVAQSSRKSLPTRRGCWRGEVESATSRSSVGRASNWATEAAKSLLYLVYFKEGRGCIPEKWVLFWRKFQICGQNYRRHVNFLYKNAWISEKERGAFSPSASINVFCKCYLLKSNEPIIAFPTRLQVRPAKNQIILRIRAVWSESLLSAWWRFGSMATHWVSCEDSDWTEAQADQNQSSLDAHVCNLVGINVPLFKCFLNFCLIFVIATEDSNQTAETLEVVVEVEAVVVV